MAKIVVGVDGSPESEAALAFAIDRARRDAADLEVVYVYPPHSLVLPMYFATGQRADGRTAIDSMDVLLEREAEVVRGRDDLREAFRARATRMVENMMADAGGQPPDTSYVLIADHHPARRLRERAESADLLVVGSHGRDLNPLHLGSVSRASVEDPPCPVVVVPPKVGADSRPETR